MPVHVNFRESRWLSRHMSVRLFFCVFVHKIVFAVCRAEGFPPNLSSLAFEIQLKCPPNMFSSVDDRKAEIA